MEDQKSHFLLVTFPAQGHINPALHFADRLIKAGALVTFVTSVSAYRRMPDNFQPQLGLTFATISDGYDDGFRSSDGDVLTYLTKFRQRGTETLTDLFHKTIAQGNGITCLVYTILLPWAAQVAREFHLPTALLWVQPASVFDIYYYYFNGYKAAISECENDPSWSLHLPNMSFGVKPRDLPSFLLPSTPLPHNFGLPSFKDQFDHLKKEENPTILVNTFEALEYDSLQAIESIQLIPVGPLLPLAFLEDRSFSGDLFQHPKDTDYIDWLDSREESSVIYVSFGSISVLPKAQMEELGRALIQTHRPFLWVIRENKEKHNDDNTKVDEVEEELSCMEQVKKQGFIVPWCSQVEVLSHPSVGCFVTHCGWNSTLESLTLGVPMVGFPQWADQTTNAKLVEEVWKTGVRVEVSKEEGLVKNEEIKRCLEMVMESNEMKKNAKKWRSLAVEAANEGGSSDINLKTFIKEVINKHP